MDWLEVEREVKKLIRDDLLAEKVEWELLYTDEDLAAALAAGADGGVAAGAGEARVVGGLSRLSSQSESFLQIILINRKHYSCGELSNFCYSK